MKPSTHKIIQSLLFAGVALCTWSLVAIGTCSAQSAKATPRKARTKQVTNTVEFIQRNLIHVRLGFWGARLVKNGKKYSVGLTTLGSMRELFFEDRIASRHFDSYRRFYATGFAFTLVGLGVLLADVVLLTINPQIVSSPGGLPLTLGLLVTGAAFGLLGPILIGVGNNRLMQAINTYNQGVFSRARKGRWRITGTFKILPQGGATAGIALII